jgi:sphingolipid 4-desaturase/C4-monooxygenase
MPDIFIPISLFKRYHMEHHQFQGSIDKDTDVPTVWEGQHFRGVFAKMIWVFLQPVAYSIRPMITCPKAPKRNDIINWIVVIAANVLYFHFWGVKALAYPFLSTVLGFGIHPMAGHLIAEHYVFTPGYETYSYYGPLNYLAWNVGYHNEHHDFPRVPGWKLPMVKKLAPEFYDDLPCHSSWPGVLFRFIFDPKICPFDRVVRDRNDKKSS